MTEEERKVYLQKKAERKAAREQKRREKYGDRYDEVVAKHERWVSVYINTWILLILEFRHLIVPG